MLGVGPRSMRWNRARGVCSPPPLGPANYPRAVAPKRRPYRTLDGEIAALVYNDKQWNTFIKAVQPPWNNDSFNTLEQRARQIDTVYSLLGETFAQRTTQELSLIHISEPTRPY